MGLIHKWPELIECGDKCIVVGVDDNHEWMLKWWYFHYNKHNNYPIVFADFGMSRFARQWCAKHGTIVDITDTIRRNWFKKPSAILNCPYNYIIWMDIDCEIRGNIGPLFNYADDGIGVTVDPHNPHVKSDSPVASGIIVTKYGEPLIEEWAYQCIHDKTKKRGDQEIFNILVADKYDKLAIMPPEYQWLRVDGDNKDALIMHWTGTKGKAMIRRRIRTMPSAINGRTTVAGGNNTSISLPNGDQKRIDSLIGVVKNHKRVIRNVRRSQRGK